MLVAVVRLIVLLVTFSAAKALPLVQTNYGKIQGFAIPLSSSNAEANVFLGIPFASPPVGDLRFKKPVEPQGWSNVLKADKFSPSCVPHHRDAAVGPISEDCLYLNIMTPEAECENPEGYPVMFWVHGGGYCFGAAYDHGYRNVSDNFVSKGIVVVTIQYRLGPLGFLSTGDEILPGNLGLWDQAAALKFVYENIANFGGNPKKITVWGLSAGGASAQQLTVSPITRDYIYQSIEMSGSALAEWATNDRIVDVSRELARNLECPLESRELLECMRTRSMDEILDGVDRTGSVRDEISMVKYAPRIDGEFFPHDYEKLFAEAPKQAAIIGMTAKESTFFTILGFAKTINSVHVTRDNFTQFDRNTLVTFIRDTVAPEKVVGAQAVDVQNRLIRYYVERDEPENADYKFYLERYTELCSDVQINIPALFGAQMKREHGWPVYLYLHEYFNDALFEANDPAVGSPHGNELYPLFGIALFSKLEMTTAEQQNQEMIVETFANFAKTGNPSTKTINWTRTDASNPRKYLSFDVPEPQMKDELMSQAFDFWTELQRDVEYDLTRGILKVAKHSRDDL